MSSVGPTSRGFKQSQGGYFVGLVGLDNKVLAYSGGSGNGGSAVVGSFSTAQWATSVANANASPHVSTLKSSGCILRDMGKSVVSSGRLFRKVQLLVSSVSTGGVNGTSGNPYPNAEYLTGYLELPNASGSGNQLAVAPVAYLPSVAF